MWVAFFSSSERRHGMSLFGIYAHGMTESWKMEKALIALVAAESERHTAENIQRWTDDALNSIGFNPNELCKSIDVS